MASVKPIGKGILSLWLAHTLNMVLQCDWQKVNYVACGVVFRTIYDSQLWPGRSVAAIILNNQIYFDGWPMLTL